MQAFLVIDLFEKRADGGAGLVQVGPLLCTRYSSPEQAGEASYGVISNTEPKVVLPSP